VCEEIKNSRLMQYVAMEGSANSSEASLRKLFLPSLAMASFASGPISVIAALLLIDIGNTFSISVGVAGQVNAAYSIAALGLALLTSVLSVRFNHRSLLLFGVLLMAVSALGCFLVQDFASLLVFYSLSGAGYAITNPMMFTLVGENVVLEKRPRAIGWIVAAGALPYVIGAPVIAVMSGFGGWRFPLLGFVLPILLMTLLTAFLGLPKASGIHGASLDAKAHLGFKEILMNRSAVSCLVGDTLRSAAFVAILIYSTSFFRQRFLMPVELASLVLLGGALAYALGSLSTGRLVNRIGRKFSTASTVLLSGIFTVTYVLVPSVSLSVLAMVSGSWFFGMAASSANSLTLEQIPKLRGALMSIDTAGLNIGSALGTMVGGLTLLYFGYEGMGSGLGMVGLAGAMVFFLLAKDPTKRI
jgi:predicted MFS family arabinose efflux permease